MSLSIPNISCPSPYQGYIAAEMWAILGGYRQGTFKHENLSNNDLISLNKTKEIITATLEEIERANKKINFREEKLNQSLDLEFIISLHPLIKTPLELKNDILNYGELLNDVIERKPLDKNKLDKTYKFFRNIAEKADKQPIEYLCADD